MTRRKNIPRSSVADRIASAVGAFLAMGHQAQRRLDDAHGDAIEALHGHRCGPRCWHNMFDERRRVGFWAGPGEDPSLPNPADLIDLAWVGKERDAVLRFLSDEPKQVECKVEMFFGVSKCRICGCDNGNREFSDGTYIWPQGFAHYVIEHHVKPSQEFIDHAMRRR